MFKESTDYSLEVKQTSNDVVIFDKNRIIIVLLAETSIDKYVAEEVANEVESYIKTLKLKNITSSLIRELVDVALVQRGLYEFRDKHARLGMPAYDIDKCISDRNNENSNIPHSPEEINLHIAGNVIKQFALTKVFSKQVAEAHDKGDIHLHDLDYVMRPYSYYQEESVIVKSPEGLIKVLSFVQLFNLVTSDIEYLKGFEVKYPIGWQVLDAGVWVELKRVMRHSTDKKLLAVNTKNGRTVIVTEDHPFIKLVKEEPDDLHCPKCSSKAIVENGSTYRCKDCKRQTRKHMIYKHPNGTLVTEKVPTSEITNKCYVITPFVILNKGAIEPDYLNSDFCWLLGIYIAEGSRDKNRVTIRNADKSIIDRIVAILESYNIKYNIKPNDPSRSKDCMAISFHADHLHLDELNIRSGSSKIALPIDYINYGNMHIGSLLAGIFDGDGTLRSEQYVTEGLIRLTSKLLLNQIQTWMDLIGIKNYLAPIDSYGPRMHKGIKIESKLPLYCLRFYLKQEDLIYFKESFKLSNYDNFIPSRVAPKIDQVSQVSKIIEIPNDSEYVYDITTSSSTFSCNGIWVSNCSGHSIEYIKKYGLDLPNLLSAAAPAKNATVLLLHMVKFATIMQGHFAGAIGWSSVNVFFAPLLVDMPYVEVKQLAQMMIFEFAQQATSRGGQATFTDLNVSYEIPSYLQDVPALGSGGKPTGQNYSYYIKESQIFLKAIFEVYMSGDINGSPFMFPKLLLNLTDDFFKTDGWGVCLHQACELASKMGSTYFVFNRGKFAKVSECCFHADQKVIVKTSRGINICGIGDVCKNYTEGKKLEVFHKGYFKKAVPVTVDYADFIKVTTSNGQILVMTDNHICSTKDGDKAATDLTLEDYIPSNNVSYNYNDEVENYDMGYFVGAYLGDGNLHLRNSNCNTLVFSLSEIKRPVIDVITKFAHNYGAHIVIDPETDKHVIPVRITSYTLKSLIMEFVDGELALVKGLNKRVFEMSMNFRRGLLAGLYATDGGNSNRLYTSSKRMLEDISALYNTLGESVNIVEDNRKFKVGGKYSNNTVYCIRPYSKKSHYSKRPCYLFINNMYYFKVAKIEKVISNNLKKAYCFRMLEGDEYFTLANGLITHNCRLKFALDEKDYEDAKEPWKLRFAAMQNITLNLPRLAYLADHDDSKLFALISKRMALMARAHKQKRYYIKKLFDLGVNGPLNVLTVNKDGQSYLRWNKLTYLIGISGLNELVHAHTGEELHESDKAFQFGLEVIAYMNLESKKLSKKHNMKFLLEESPFETGTYRMAKSDVKRFPKIAPRYVQGNLETGAIYYTNSVHYRYDSNINFIQRIKEQGKFHPLIEAGSIVHVWLGEKRPPAEALMKVVINSYKKTSCEQLAFSPEFTLCSSCKKTSRGLHNQCPYCSSTKVEGITRITGYFSKISSWNMGKKQELKDRFRESI